MADPQLIEMTGKLKPLLAVGLIFGLLIIPFLLKKADAFNKWLKPPKKNRRR